VQYNKADAGSSEKRLLLTNVTLMAVTPDTTRPSFRSKNVADAVAVTPVRSTPNPTLEFILGVVKEGASPSTKGKLGSAASQLKLITPVFSPAGGANQAGIVISIR
jgi:hypothetical protein